MATSTSTQARLKRGAQRLKIQQRGFQLVLAHGKCGDDGNADCQADQRDNQIGGYFRKPEHEGSQANGGKQHAGDIQAHLFRFADRMHEQRAQHQQHGHGGDGHQEHAAPSEERDHQARCDRAERRAKRTQQLPMAR